MPKRCIELKNKCPWGCGHWDGQVWGKGGYEGVLGQCK